jgi:hypothetical protein
MAGKKASIRIIDDLSKNIDSTDILKKKAKVLTELYDLQEKNVEILLGKYERASARKKTSQKQLDEKRNEFLLAQMEAISLAEEIDNTRKALEPKNVEGSEPETTDNMSKGIKNILGKFINVDNAKKGFQQTIGAAAKLNEQSVSMQAAFGDTDMGKSYFNNLKAYAIETGHDLESLTGITKKFTGVTKNANSLMGLTDTASKLSLKTGDLGSAGDLIQEAMEGRYDNLQNVLNLDDGQMEPLKQAIKKGSMDGIIDAFGETLNTAGLTDEIMEAYQNSPIQKYEKIMNGFKTKLAVAGEGALEKLVPILEKVEELLQSEKANRFFGVISAGLEIIVGGVAGLIGIISDMWPAIETILSVAVPTMIAGLWAMVPPIWAQVSAWMVSNMQTMLWVGAILLAIKLLNNLGVAGHVIGFIAGLFSSLWVIIHNGIAYVYNRFITFAEFLVNLFIDPIYAIKMLFYNLAMNVLGYFNSLLDGITRGLNFLIEKVNNILGTNFEKKQFEFIDNAITKLEKNKPTSDKNVWEAARMEFRDFSKVGDAFQWGKQLPDKLAGKFGAMEESIRNVSSNGDMLNTLQQDNLAAINNNGAGIKDSIDKSDEELQWMKEFAEQEAINRFTSATLAPQISVQFGDVRETADVDGIVDHIERVLTEQINIAAEGVYS